MRLSLLVLPVLILNVTACGVKAKNDGSPKLPSITQESTNAAPKVSEATNVAVPHQTHLPEAQNVRQASLEQLLSSESASGKTEAAEQYLSSFDFQVASYDKLGGEKLAALRDDLIAAALVEFSETVIQLKGSSSRLNATHKDNKFQSLVALTVAMSEVNVLQSKNKELAPVSMYDVLSEGLLRRELVRKKKLKKDQLTKADKLVGEQYKLARYLLQLRLRGLSLVALSQVSGLQEDLLLYMFSEWFPSWEPNFENMTIEQINKTTATINRAILTRNVLYTLNYEGELDRSVLGALKRMKAKKEIQKLDQVRDADRIQALERYHTALIGLIDN